EGIRRIARRVHAETRALARAIEAAGFALDHQEFFDTIAITTDAGRAEQVMAAARERRINFRRLAAGRIAVSLDETVTARDLADVAACFGATIADVDDAVQVPAPFARTSGYLDHPV